MKHYIISIILTTFAATCCAQGRFAFEDTFHNIDTTQCKELHFRIVNQNFFKNDEYFGDFIEGYTLPGYKLQPSIFYNIASNVSIEVGAQMLQYGGTNKFDHIFPIVTAQWQINPTFSLTMGMIDGGIHHELPEAILDPETQLDGRPETGIQIKAHTSNFYGELFMNWQQFIKMGDTIPERFMAGLSIFYSNKNSDNQLYIDIPFHLTVSHIGGQISNYDDRMQSLANGSLALRFNKNINKFVQNLFIETEGLFFYTMTGSDVRPFANGGAFYPKIGIISRLFDTTLGYYHAKDFFALHGNPLFMSLSNYKNDVYISRRQMITAEANLNHKISSSARFSIGAKCYFDTNESQLEYYYGFFLVLTPDFKILKYNK